MTMKQLDSLVPEKVDVDVAGGSTCTVSGEDKKPNKTGFTDLFRYADRWDKWLMILGTIGAAGEGLAVPLIGAVLSKLIDQFGSLQRDVSQLYSNVNKYTLYMVYISICGSLAAYLEVACWIRTGERQSAVIKSKYLRAILRQDVGFFDGRPANTTGASTAQLLSSVAKDGQVIQDAISEKVGNILSNLLQFLFTYAVSFYVCWQLALLALVLPLMVFIPGFMYKTATDDISGKMMADYDRANGIAEESISSIRTVQSCAAERQTVKEFSMAQAGTVKLGFKLGLAKGTSLALTGLAYLLWGAMGWLGQVLVAKGKSDGGQIIVVGFISSTTVLSLAHTLPNIKSFVEGTLVGRRIFELIDRVPPIDSDNMSGQVLDSIQGRIQLRDVGFCYPSRPDVQVLKSFNLTIPAGMTVALVGSSGSGKSTVIALLERFYDPQQGEVLIDDINITQLQLKSLRRQIGLVSQEPALFATSIKENILYGKDGASSAEVVEAAKSANAHLFISQCHHGYDTQVGERGIQLSGGQKQRIAIARAILKNPAILLLDEATSALDAQSEQVVQATLEKAAKGRTTVIVAHRLSTIRNADTIAVVQSGVVVEIGTHEELVAKAGGVYSSMVSLQNAQVSKFQDAVPAPQQDSWEKGHLRKNSHSRSQDSSEQGHLRKDSRSKSQSMAASFRSLKSSAASSLRVSSLSRSLRMLNLSGSLARALSEGMGDKADDFDTMIDLAAADEEHGQPKDVTIWRLLALNAPEWKEALLGAAGAFGHGAWYAIFSFLLGTMLQAFYNSSSSTAKHKVDVIGALFTAITVASVVTMISQHYFFAVMGEKLTARVRELMLSRILSFEAGWFDRDGNGSGAICAKLSSDAAMVRTLVGDRLCVIVAAVAGIAIAYAISLAISWRLSVVMIAVQPLVIMCYAGKRIFLDKLVVLAARTQLEASQVASEAVSQLRTITAFCSQDKVLNLYETKMKGLQLKSISRCHTAGIGVGATLAVFYCSWALMFWYGAQVVKQGRASFGAFFKIFFMMATTSSLVADSVVSLAPDLARGSQAMASVFQILDRKTKIEPEEGEKPGTKIEGKVELQNVTFAYPERPHIVVFKSFNLQIAAGTTVAMVGQSGSGKSTIVSLIERFYDPLHGRVLIDGQDIRRYNLRALRAQIGLVAQEPTLFATSIRMNIAYGKENCTEAEVIEAAKAANAHTFISSLPDGYDTYAGSRGLELSGGQKQRIAIARAVLKSPSILLLDEATSALDTETEALVQSALDKMMAGRTTVVVAHRLSTIRHAHTIAVLQNGSIVEQGTHHELMDRGEVGTYFSLVQMQTKA